MLNFIDNEIIRLHIKCSKKNCEQIPNTPPNLPKHLFWDQRFDEIDWVVGYRSIIARVIERGSESDWQEMLRFYGRYKVVNVLFYEIKYLPDFSIEDVCNYFKLRKENL